MLLIAIHLCPLRHRLRLESSAGSFMTKIVSEGVPHFKTLKTRLLNSSVISNRVRTQISQTSMTQTICKSHPTSNNSNINTNTLLCRHSGYLSLLCRQVTCMNNSTTCKSRCTHLVPFKIITATMLTLRSKAFSKMRVHSARRRSTLIKA